MSKTTFMSMRWLRLHVKEIIWATVTLFVGSIFIIGYGTSLAIEDQEERKRAFDESEQRADYLRNLAPKYLLDKLNLPVAYVSLNSKNASSTSMIDVKTLWRAIKDLPEYQQLQGDNFPEGIRKTYGSMLKERVLGDIITTTLVELYAKLNGIKPRETAEMLVARDREQISPVEFERRLRRQGLSDGEYGEGRLKELTVGSVANHVMQVVPLASATEDFLRKYYETNKIRFKEDNKISFNHMLVSPDDFVGQVQITEEEIKVYFDKNRASLVSSPRVSVSHIFIDPKNKNYVAGMKVSEDEIRRRYTDNLSRFKEEEKVRARHILINPKNSFVEEFADFTVNLRNFRVEKIDEKWLYIFDAGISDIQSGAKLDNNTFTLVTQDGQSIALTSESLEKTEDALGLPLIGSTKIATRGNLGFFAEDENAPVKLLINDGVSSRTIDISAAFDEEEAFAVAEKQIKDIQQQINSGKDFIELAKEVSQDIGSADKGGDLGTFSRGAMVKPFEDVAFTTGVGKVAEPVRSQFGWHLIKVEEKILEKTKSLDSVRSQVESELKDEKAKYEAESTLETIKQKVTYKSDTFENLVKLHSMAPSRKDSGKLPILFMGEITADYSEEQQKALRGELGNNGAFIQKEIESVIFALGINEVSDVVKTIDGYHLFKLENKYEPVQLALTPTLKNYIRQILEKESGELKAREKAEELRSNNLSSGVEELSKKYFKPENQQEIKITYADLPFELNPGMFSYALSDGIGQFSEDGRVYLPEIHEALKNLVSDNGWKDKTMGPIKSNLGYHIIEVTAYEGDRYETFDEIKDKLRSMATLEPTAEEISKEFETSADNFDVPATRIIRQILVSDENTAIELHKRLQDGEIFALLANRYSIDGSAGNGGLTSPVKRGQLSSELDKAIWSLKKGEITGVIKTSYGFVIAMLDQDETLGKKAELNSAVTSALRQKIRREHQNLAWSYFLKGLNNQASVVRQQSAIDEI